MKRLLILLILSFYFVNVSAQKIYISKNEFVDCIIQINDSVFNLIVCDKENKVYHFSEGKTMINKDTLFLNSNPMFNSNLINYAENLGLLNSKPDTCFLLPIIYSFTSRDGLEYSISFDPNFNKTYSFDEIGIAKVPSKDFINKKILYVKHSLYTYSIAINPLNHNIPVIYFFNLFPVSNMNDPTWDYLDKYPKHYKIGQYEYDLNPLFETILDIDRTKSRDIFSNHFENSFLNFLNQAFLIQKNGDLKNLAIESNLKSFSSFIEFKLQ
jgi:hypothetical protein